MKLRCKKDLPQDVAHDMKVLIKDKYYDVIIQNYGCRDVYHQVRVQPGGMHHDISNGTFETHFYTLHEQRTKIIDEILE